jgi:hypothetical protein
MTRSEEILTSIANSLSIQPGSLRIGLIFLVGAVVVLTIAAVLQRLVGRRREIADYRERFQSEIRKLNLTILELDVLDRLAAHLRDPEKRVNLLTNRSTFLHCTKAVGELPDRLRVAHRQLSERLGFAGGAAVPGPLISFVPPVGTGVKIGVPGAASERVPARVTAAESDNLVLQVGQKTHIEEATQVIIIAPHASGLVGAKAVVMSSAPGRLVLQLTERFHLSNASEISRQRLRIQVRRGSDRDQVEHAELISVWGTGAEIECTGDRLRKGESLEIFIHRDKDAWAGINAEVRKVRRGGKRARVEFSHLSRDARKTILGL